MSLELISAIIYKVYLFWKTAVFPYLVIILCVIAIVAYALQNELFQKIKRLLYKSPSSEKAAEPVDTTILKDSLYHYQEFKRDKSLGV